MMLPKVEFEFDLIEKKIGFSFKNKDFLLRAFTHKSVLNENKELPESNERLEYLGDAVLELIVTEYLFSKYENLSEGELTNLRTQIVRQDTLAQVCKDLDVSQNLLMSQGEVKNNGFEKDSILEDLYEALVGAIYLDRGFLQAKKFVIRTLLKKKSKDIQVKKDPKGQLQEKIQEKFNITPFYKTVEVSRDGNTYLFHSEVFMNETKIGEGHGGKKLSAEEEAAKDALKRI